MRTLILLAVMIAATAAATEIYRWVDADGQAHYSDQWQPGAERIHIQESPGYSTPPSGAAPAGEAPPAAPGSSYQVLEIASPAQEEVLWNTETLEVMGEKNVEGVRVRNIKTGEESIIPAMGFFVAIGHKPNTDIFKGQLDMDSVGYLITKPGTTQTNRPGVFATGDAQDKVYRQAITAAGTGCMGALEAERYLSAIETHEHEMQMEKEA